VIGFVHAPASSIVTVYVPGANPVAVAVICAGVVFHEYVYGGYPPVTVAVAVAETELRQSKKSINTPESKMPSPASAIANLK
jgi:hypothetical protein